MLIEGLILFFIILLTYQIIASLYCNREGLENSSSYQNYGNTPTLQQNAENIEYLNNTVESILTVQEDISKNVQTLQQQYQDLVSQQANSAQSSVTSTSAPLSGGSS